MKLKKLITFDLLELALRIWTTFCLLLYGTGKWYQFEGSKLIDVSIKDATGFQIMWAFFGTTQTYPIIIGCFEIVGGILLIFRRTKLLGALLLTPIFVNIIMLDIFYKIHPGALWTAIVFQSLFLLIIIQQRIKIIEVFKILILSKDKAITGGMDSIKFMIAGIIALLLFFGFLKASGYV